MDYNELRQAIKSMTPRTQLYEALKEELTALGHWKLRARGKSIDRVAQERSVD